jgi:hypothetical protein
MRSIFFLEKCGLAFEISEKQRYHKHKSIIHTKWLEQTKAEIRLCHGLHFRGGCIR